MTQNDQYHKFFKLLKVAFTNGTFYKENHPKFVSSVKELQRSIVQSVGDDPALVINIRPDALMIHQAVFDDDVFCQDLAGSLHLKKIKTVSIGKDVKMDELKGFIYCMITPREVIEQQGGMEKVLRNQQIEAIHVEPLDYSALVRGNRQEIRDAWEYLFQSHGDTGATGEQPPHAFESQLRETIEKWGVQEVMNDAVLSDKLASALSDLKDRDKKMFIKSVLSLSKKMLQADNVQWQGDKEQVKALFQSLSPDEIQQILMDLFHSEHKGNPAAFELFSSFIRPDVRAESAELLNQAINEEQATLDLQKIQQFFGAVRENTATTPYLHKLKVVRSSGVPQAKFVFDYDQLYENYRMILLDLFSIETKPQRVQVILDRISHLLDKPFLNNTEYFQEFKAIYDAKATDQDLAKVMADKSDELWAFAEKNHFQQEDTRNFEYLLDVMSTSSLDDSYYLDKIFQDNQYNTLTLRLFFLLFPTEIMDFYQHIDAKIKDEPFMNQLIDRLSQVEDALSLEVLKYIFSVSSFLRKIELLDVFKRFSIFDRDFLMELVNDDNFSMRKKAVEVAVTFRSLNKEIARTLFHKHYYWGLGRKNILEDLDILEDNYIPEAKPFLVHLSKDILFWNKPLKVKAKKILSRYQEYEGSQRAGKNEPNQG